MGVLHFTEALCSPFQKDGTSEKGPPALPALLAPVLLQVGTGKDVLGMQKLLLTIY